MGERFHENKELKKFNLRVLVAEDTVFNQKMIKRLLNKWGLEVKIANNGKEAVTTFLNDSFDLILMDVKMPEMDGFEAARKIREIEEKHGNHTPIIAMTACSEDEEKERCIVSGMDGYIPKAIAPEKIYEFIRSVEIAMRATQ